jgi:hypothetical protein
MGRPAPIGIPGRGPEGGRARPPNESSWPSERAPDPMKMDGGQTAWLHRYGPLFSEQLRALVGTGRAGSTTEPTVVAIGPMLPAGTAAGPIRTGGRAGRRPAAQNELESARRPDPRRVGGREGGTPRRAGFDPGAITGDHGPGDRTGPDRSGGIGRRGRLVHRPGAVRGRGGGPAFRTNRAPGNLPKRT